MMLKGSCHCGEVTFQLESKRPYPYQLCYCGICRKTAGAGGVVINIAGDYNSMTIHGKENLGVYNAVLKKSTNGKSKVVSPAQRNFCKLCGSPLWLYDPRWPELVHPHASAIDTELPVPPERTHIMLNSKPVWMEPCFGPNDQKFDEYPKESIADWHKRLGLEK